MNVQNTIARSFATVAAVYDDGISLLFDGSETPSQKHYKCNRALAFAVGDRVHLAYESGTYIVEYPVGNPNPQGKEMHDLSTTKVEKRFPDLGNEGILFPSMMETGKVEERHARFPP